MFWKCFVWKQNLPKNLTYSRHGFWAGSLPHYLISCLPCTGVICISGCYFTSFLSVCDCVTTCRYHPWVSEGVQCANGVVFLNLVGSPTEACTGRQIALVLTGQLRLPQHCIYLSSDLLIETVLSFWDVCQMSQAVVIFFMSSLPDVNKLGVLFQCLVLHITLDKKCAFLLSEVCGSIHIIFWLYGWQNCFSYWGRFRGRVVG